jgi:hypothetical protein
VQDLAVLCYRFAGASMDRGLPRWRRDQPGVIGVVAEVRPMPGGEVAVFGPRRASFPGHFDVQAPAIVHRPEGLRVPATYVGCFFDLSGWPPRMGLLLGGVRPEDLSPGTRFSADLSEQQAIVRGMAEGSLKSVDVFGEVRREGLGPDQLMLLFETPERVRVPAPRGTPLNESVVRMLREMDAHLASRRPRRRRTNA